MKKLGKHMETCSSEVREKLPVINKVLGKSTGQACEKVSVGCSKSGKNYRGMRKKYRVISI